MSFTTNFATEFFSFKADPELDKYLFNVSDPILLMRYDETLEPEVENEDEEDIENSDRRSFLSVEGL